MAQNKTKSDWAAFVHAFTYSLSFLLLHPSWHAMAIILTTHFFIDRFRLARYVIYAKNHLGPRLYVYRGKWRRYYPWSETNVTGYGPEVPAWLSVWLLIIADNTLHLTINYLALRFL